MLSQESGEVPDWSETEILFFWLRPIALEAPGWPEYRGGAGHDIERPSAGRGADSGVRHDFGNLGLVNDSEVPLVSSPCTAALAPRLQRSAP